MLKLLKKEIPIQTTGKQRQNIKLNKGPILYGEK